ncbi:MAG: lamin tail domain-containing protein, partial [Candidatus Izemoplasmatales bacterium]|nr:lamin tail domain-containing protein [Candidatus Izemoplasmatales bacterium]
MSFAEYLADEEGYIFTYWLINDTLFNSLPIDYSFKIKGSLSITAIFRPYNQYVSVFRDSNGKVLSIQYVSHGGTIDDSSIVLPSKPGMIIASNKWDKALTNIQANTIFTLQYSQNSNQTSQVTVTNGSGSGSFLFNSIATVSANQPQENEYFLYWKSGDRILSYQSSYSFTVLTNISIEAVYSSTPLAIIPTISIKKADGLRVNHQSFIGQFELPLGYELVEYGMITSEASGIFQLGSPNTQKYIGNKYLPTTNEFLFSFTNPLILSVRAYLIVKDVSGNFITVYDSFVTVNEEPVFTSDLFFSFYMEGSSSNKAISIFNGTGQPINMTGYSIKLYANGATTPTSTLNLSGTLVHNSVYVIANSQANATILSYANITHSVTNYNGNDAITLEKSGTVIDSIGQVGNNPGSFWGSGIYVTMDRTLVRKATTLSGDSNALDAYNPETYWESFAIDSTNGI